MPKRSVKNRILNGDFFEINKQILDELGRFKIDLVVVDVPYGVTGNKWDTVFDLKEMWRILYKLCKSKCAMCFTSQQPFTTTLIKSNPKAFRYELIWDKGRGNDFLRANIRPIGSHESVIVFYKEKPTYNPQKIMRRAGDIKKRYTKNCATGEGYSKHNKVVTVDDGTRFPTSVLRIPAVSNGNKDKFHPTQKPVALYEWLIKSYSNEGDLVLDFCSGSGVLSIAAHNTKRDFICIEKDPVYWRKSKRRYHDHKKGLS